MSTRANIKVTDSYGDVLWFYRHSDGYPKGTLPTLKKFMQWVKEGKIRDNMCQASGWLIVIGREEQREEMKDVSSSFYDWKVGSYQPTTEQHGDIEYLYILDLDKLVIKVCHPDGKCIKRLTNFKRTIKESKGKS